MLPNAPNDHNDPKVLELEIGKERQCPHGHTTNELPPDLNDHNDLNDPNDINENYRKALKAEIGKEWWWVMGKDAEDGQIWWDALNALNDPNAPNDQNDQKVLKAEIGKERKKEEGGSFLPKNSRHPLTP